jgi:hypothetical protein
MKGCFYKRISGKVDRKGELVMTMRQLAKCQKTKPAHTEKDRVYFLLSPFDDLPTPLREACVTPHRCWEQPH